MLKMVHLRLGIRGKISHEISQCEADSKRGNTLVQVQVSEWVQCQLLSKVVWLSGGISSTPLLRH